MTRETGTQGLVGTFSVYLLTKVSEGYEGVSVIGNEGMCSANVNITQPSEMGEEEFAHTHKFNRF